MKLHKLRAKNFGCYGDPGIELLIDNIVVLIGKNDVGKSTVLDAYEAFASMGAPLPIDKFHDRDSTKQIEIEAEFTEVSDDDLEVLGGKKWIHELENGVTGVRARWIWTSPGQKGTKQAFDGSAKQWVTGGLGGWDTKLQSRVPKPMRLRPDSKPEELEGIICSILIDAVKEAAKRDKDTGTEIVKAIQELTNQFRDTVNADIDKACIQVTAHLGRVFPGYSVQFVPGSGSIDPAKLIGAGSYVEIHSPDDSKTRLSGRGAGVQRSFVWSALAALADMGLKIDKKHIGSDFPKVLLIEEPESFLHPPAIRRARECLYAIAEITNWQIICNTHSPIFIDLSKPHTTIIRVWRDQQEAVQTRVYQSDLSNFDETDRERLRMVRACDPYVAEFFFADHIWIVEGETEQIAYQTLISIHASDTSVHILNARGKANIPMFIKILGQFKTPFVAIHDSDSPKTLRDKKYINNSAWTINLRIQEALVKCDGYGTSVKRVVHVPDFEGHYFKVRLKSGKTDYVQDLLLAPDYMTSSESALLRGSVQRVIDGTHECFCGDHADLTRRVKVWSESADESLLGEASLWALD